ncbi:TolC family protein [Hugenholtzia roseola]|uniref:TolC family protein n=1 Tax=Hugenholtzia roseola TaxID=1002 RepID=UPI0003FD0ADB|nr:TolC family protein [Hugenholtzia roseola]
MKNIKKTILLLLPLFFLNGCKIPTFETKEAQTALPQTFSTQKIAAQANIATLGWKDYFQDSLLIALIDTALSHNQELNMRLQEVLIEQNEIQARKGEYLPFVSLRAGAGVEKEGRYTRLGAVEENLEIKPDTHFPEPLPNYMFGLYASWELDVWKKLRNAKKSAALRYLASVEGNRFFITTLIAEIAESYYELLALDNLLKIIEQNIKLQENVLQAIKLEKEAAKVSQLAVNRFEAQYLNTQNLQYQVRQEITVIENKINFLMGQYPQPIRRNALVFDTLQVRAEAIGAPAQLLTQRPDIKQAELKLAAAKLDVQVAKAYFYPALSLDAGIGMQAFQPALLFNLKSLLFNAATNLAAPLVNRNAIQALYKNANAKQVQAVYYYEQTLLNAYLEVCNQLAQVENFNKSYELKNKEVDILMQSIGISTNLFRAARADYMEVLLTQREALDAKIELIEIKRKQMQAKVNLYRALGGGWN